MNVLLTTSAAPDQTPFSTNEKRPPVGLGYLISVLREAGHRVFFIDNYLAPSNFLETDYLQKNQIDFVGIYTNTICFRDSLRMFYRLEDLRQEGIWKGKIIAGGPHASVSPETIPSFVDHIVVGEGEFAILDIVAGKVKERIIQYPTIENLDELPMPAWDCFAEMPYNWGGNWLPEAPVFTMNTSRGCPFDCTFCSVGSIWGRRYTYFSAERVVADIEHVVKHHGAKGIYFREDNFTLNKKRLYEFCALMIDKGVNIPWVCETRASSLDRETVELMARAGARGAYIGVESGSQRLLDFMQKGIKLEDIHHAFRLCQEFGINTAASVIVGVPTETEHELQMTIELLDEIRPTVTWFNAFVGIPKSKLYMYVLENKLYEYIDDRGLVYLKGHNERVSKWYGKSCDAELPIQLQNNTIVNPRVSVVMSVYNGAKYLLEAIRSIQSQTFNNFEFIIVNDASNDTTAEILQQIDDPRVRVLTNEQNFGLTKSLNKALKHCRGEFIARMDADDLSHPFRLEKQVSFLESRPECALVGSSYYVIDEDGKNVSHIGVLTESSQIKDGLKNQNWFGHGSVMMRKSALNKVGGYDEEFRYAQDYDLWLRLSEHYNVANIKEPLYFWRSTAEAISRDKVREQKVFAELAKKYALTREHLSGESSGRKIMQDFPVVSVIVPTHNRPDMLKNAIQSILDQTFQDLEIIVVNDAGQDVSVVVSAFNSPKITYLSHELNKGLAGTRNTGIRAAKGKYIAYLDDDDIFYPEHLETLVTFLQKTGEKVAYTDAARAHQRLDGDCYVTYLKEAPYSYDFNYDRILYENFIPVLCFMHEKACVDVCGTFDETFSCLEDWELWLRMSRHFTMNHIKSLTCEYSYRPDGSSMVTGSLTNLMYMTERLYKKHHVDGRPDIKELRDEQLQQMLKDRLDTKERYAAVQFYFDNGSGIREDNYSVFKVKCNQELQTAIIDISDPATLSSIRIDPHGDCVILELESISLVSDTRQLDLISTGKMINNARIVEGNRYYFETDDPQFIFRDIGDFIFPDAQKIVFQARYISLGKEALHAFVNKLVQSSDGDPKEVEKLTTQTSSHDDTFIEQQRITQNGQHSQSYTNMKKNTALLNVYPISTLPAQSSQPGKIAIHLHLYYIDLADELLPYFARMPFDFDLFVTVVDAQMVTFVEQKALKLCGKHLVKLNVITVPNRGRDIAALLVPLQNIYKNYDYICHVHSKKSLYSGAEQLDWCKYLFTSLFWNETHIRRIFGLFDAEAKIGQIYPTTFQRMPYWCHSWLSNHGSSYELFKQLKIKLDISQYIDYPVGSMLWLRSKSLQPFFDLNLTFDNFPPEPTPNDGTICHAIERSFNIAGHLQGYTFAELDIVSDDFTIGEGKKNLWQYWDKNIDQLWKTLEQFQIISFDIFDTLLTRPLLLPDHAFLLMQYRIEHELNIHLDFLTVRKQAESFVRQSLPRGSDASLPVIYEVFKDITGLGVEVTDRIKQIEIDTEINLSLPREGMLDLVRQLQLTGKQIVFLSDMYLTSDVIAEMFSRHGFDISNIKVLISSETGIRKDTGDVWKSFLKNIGDVHVGDNEHSDIQLAVDNGVPNYHVMSSRRLFELAQPRIQLPPHNSLADSVYLGPVIARLFSSPFELHSSRGHLMISDPKDFGYCVFGPLMLYFMTWLLDKSREQGIQHLLFLSREGYLLRQLYEVLTGKTGNSGVADSYLLCSRRANSVPTLESDGDLMELLEEQYTGSLANLLETRYGIDLNVSSETKTVSDQILYKTIIKLPQDLDSVYPYVLMFKQTIYAQAKEERKTYLDYLERIGVSNGTKNAVVDIGYAGTIQKYLNKLTGINMPGFYFVTNQKALRNPYMDSMHGCFGDLVSSKDRNNVFDYSLILEAILTAPNGQFVKFEHLGNPIYRDSAHTESTWPVVRATQLGVIEYFHDTMAWFGDILLSQKPSIDIATHLFNWIAVHPEVISPSLRDALRIDDYYVSDSVVSVFDYSRNILDVATPPADVAFATSFLSDSSNNEIKVFRTATEFCRHFETIKYNYEERLLVEKVLSDKSIKSNELVYSGYCDCCTKKTHMRSDFGMSDATLNHKAYIFNHTDYSNWYGKVILFREHLVCNECGLNNRQRGIFHALKAMNLKLSKINTYAYEQVTQFYSELSKKSHRIIGSEFLGEDFQGGQCYSGVRHEDATNLSFSDGSFDLLISNDVFEHVPNIEKAFMEAHRVLAKGGKLLFSVPFDISSLQTTQRVIFNDGQLQHLFEPVYHGNPVSDKGSLVFYDFGWDIIDYCVKSGFKDAYMLYYYSTRNALIGGGLQFVFVAEK